MKNTKNLKKLHTSLCRGYVSRRRPEGISLSYKGKFGEGIKVLTPNWESTRYCFVTYFVKP